jgi:hypothetical protein
MAPCEGEMTNREILGTRVDATSYADAAGRIVAWTGRTACARCTQRIVRFETVDTP